MNMIVVVTVILLVYYVEKIFSLEVDITHANPQVSCESKYKCKINFTFESENYEYLLFAALSNPFASNLIVSNENKQFEFNSKDDDNYFHTKIIKLEKGHQNNNNNKIGTALLSSSDTNGNRFIIKGHFFTKYKGLIVIESDSNFNLNIQH